MFSKSILRKSISFIIILTSSTLISQSNTSKVGGICFRTDDNQSMAEYLEYAEVFDKYDKNFTFALNLNMVSVTPQYLEGVRQLQMKGHEMMDHTPSHKTNFFYTVLSPDYFINHPGVENIDNNKIELKHAGVDISHAKRSGYVNINGNIVTSTTGIFSDFLKTDCYLYFPELDRLVYINDYVGNWIDENTVRITDVWFGSVNLGSRQNIKFYNFDVDNVHLTLDAIKAIAEETLRMANHYGIEKPATWIQPGGYFPHVYSNELKEALSGDLGYVAAGIFANPSLKVFNEYNPNYDKQFGMNWEDFNDDNWTLKELKEIIADKVAKHHIAIGHSHFSDLLGGWEGFLQTTDDLIKWCIENDIPIKTYSQWADILYNQTPYPYENIFPNLGVNKDNGSLPDGFSKKYRNSSGEWIKFEAEWLNNDGVEESNYHSFSINKVGNICYVGRYYDHLADGLGGIEKGENQFEIWTKGAPGNFIEVDFRVGYNHLVYKFPAESSEWTKYNISESLNGNTLFVIPEDISTIDVSIRCSQFNYGNVKISGMKLFKSPPPGYFKLDITVFLEGPYLLEGSMNNSLNTILPTSQPFNIQPWNYEGTENVNDIPNQDIVDWVLVSLFAELEDSAPIHQRAGFLKKDGSVVDLDGISPLQFSESFVECYVRIDHRNHLPVISSNKLELGN